MEIDVKRGRKKKEIDGVFAKRLSELLQAAKSEKGIIQEDVAKATGITRQSLGNWANGENVPDILDLKKLAKYFNVSSDYLIGLTDNKTTDTNLKAVCKYTGLNEEAINELQDGAGDPEFRKIRNKIISDGFLNAFTLALGYLETETGELIDEVNKQLSIGKMPFVYSKDFKQLAMLDIDRTMRCDVYRYKLIHLVEIMADDYDQRKKATDENTPKK